MNTPAIIALRRASLAYLLGLETMNVIASVPGARRLSRRHFWELWVVKAAAIMMLSDDEWWS